MSDELPHRVALSSPTGFLAFGLGSGLAPVAPGTAGSAAAVPFALILVQMPLSAALAAVAASFLLGIYLCGVAGRRLGEDDHGGIVWDEFVGMWLVLVLIPPDWRWWLAGFVLFRLFDAVKPFPIRWFDRHVHGGFGVMLDDVLAAGYALAVMAIAGWLAGWVT